MKQPIDQAKRFLRNAERDKLAFHVLKNSPGIHISTVCFHAQQAIEKSLKAVLILNEKDPDRTHDLSKLCYSILDEKLSLPLPVEEISKLHPFAVIYRYDDLEIEIVTRDEAEEFVEIIYSWAENILNKHK